MERRTIIKYETNQLTNEEIIKLKQILKQKDILNKLNGQLGLLTIGDENAKITELQAEKIREDIPLLPTINFIPINEFKNITENNIQIKQIDSDVIIIEFDYYVGTESEVKIKNDDNEEVDRRKIIKLNMNSEFGFFNDYNSLELIFEHKVLDDDELKHSIRVKTIIYPDPSVSTETIEKEIVINANEFDVVRFRLSAIIFEEVSKNGEEEEENYFDVKKYTLKYSIFEKVKVEIKHIKSGIPDTENTIKQAKVEEWTNKVIKKYEMINEYSAYNLENQTLYDAKKLSVASNNILGSIKVNIGCLIDIELERTNLESGSYYIPLLTAYFENYYNKLDKIDEYISYKLKSDSVYALTTSYREQLLEYYEEGENNLITTLLQNDQIIRQYLEVALQPIDVDIFIDKIGWGKNFGMPVVLFTKNWNDAASAGKCRLAKNLTTVYYPNHADNETIKWKSAFLGFNNKTEKVFEDDKYIILINVTGVLGTENYTGYTEENNQNFMISFERGFSTTGICYIKGREDGTTAIVLPNPIVRLPTVSISKITILVKRALGHSSINKINLDLQLSIGNKYVNLNVSDGNFEPVIQEYYGRIYYGYKADTYMTVTAEEKEQKYFYDVNKKIDASARLVDVGSSFKYTTFSELEGQMGLKITYGAQRSTPTSIANMVTVELGGLAKFYMYTDGPEQVPNTNFSIKELFNDAGGEFEHNKVGDFGWCFTMEGRINVKMLFSPDLTKDNILVNSEVIDILTMSITALANNFEQLKESFNDLEKKVNILWDAAMNSTGDPFFSIFLNVLEFAGPIGEVVDAGKNLNDFRKGVKANLKYQEVARKVTIGSTKTGKQYAKTKFDLDSITLRERLLDSTLIQKGRSRHELYDLQNQDNRPHFLNGRYNEHKFDSSEMLDLHSVAASGGTIKIDDLAKLEKIKTISRNSGIMYDGPLPTFRVHSTPLQIFTQPIGDLVYSKKSIKLRRNNTKKIWETNTRRPFHTFGTFEEYSVKESITGNKPELYKTTRFIGVGEVNKTGNIGSSVGGLKYKEKYIGYDYDKKQRIWDLENFSETGITSDELNGYYSIAFKKAAKEGVDKTDDEKWCELIGGIKSRVLSSNNVLTYFPDPSFGKVVDDFMTLDIPYKILTQNCQNLMINMINFSESGRNIMSLSPSMQRVLMRSRIKYYDDVIELMMMLIYMIDEL